MFFIKEESLEEGYLFDSRTIKYQVKEFEQGKVNTLFITGISGSGKSTLGVAYAKKFNVPLYQLDDISYYWKFTDSQLKQYGKEMYDFFTKGPGKRYRDADKAFDAKGPEKWANGPQVVINDNLGNACIEFIEYVLSKNARCIIEGVQIFMAFADGELNPEALKDSAVIIMGTSAAKSTIRALTRDYVNDKKEDPNLKFIDTIPFDYLVRRIKFMMQDETALNKLRKIYNKR